MRVFVSVVATAGIVALAACSSGSKGSGSVNSPATTPTTSAVVTDTAAASAGASVAVPSLTGQAANGALCVRLAAVSKQFASVGSAMADPQTAAAALKQFVTVLQQVGSDAPPNVANAVKDLISAATEAQKALSNASSADMSKLQALAPKLAADAQTIGAYIASSCASS